jgi:hypothetical protein
MTFVGFDRVSSHLRGEDFGAAVNRARTRRWFNIRLRVVMPQYSSSIEINASPRVVWSILADVEQWPSWTPTVKRVVKLTPGPLGKGTVARITQPKLPSGAWRVTEIHEGRDFTWVQKKPGIRITGSHIVQATPGGARVTVSIRLSGLLAPIMVLFVRRLTVSYLATEARGLKARSEERVGGVVAEPSRLSS